MCAVANWPKRLGAVAPRGDHHSWNMSPVWRISESRDGMSRIFSAPTTSTTS